MFWSERGFRDRIDSSKEVASSILGSRSKRRRWPSTFRFSRTGRCLKVLKHNSSLQGNIMSRFRGCIYFTATFCLYLVMSTASLAGDKPHLRKSSGIGSAHGFVLDAATHQYLNGVSVALSVPADMEPIKNSHSLTNENGYYEIKASLGQSHTHYALDRILDGLSPADILSGGAKQVDRFLNVSRLNLIVSKAGFKTFYETVPIENADADHFRVCLSPVFLMPDAQDYVSYVNPHRLLGKIDDVEISSQFVAPDDLLHFTVTVSGVPLRPDGRINLECWGSKGGYREIVQRKPHSDIVYRSDFRIDKHSYAKPGFYVLSWGLENSDHTSVSCDVKRTVFVVGCEPEKKQQVSKLLEAYNTSANMPAGSRPIDLDRMDTIPLPVSKDFLVHITALMPPGADFTSFQAIQGEDTTALPPQSEEDFNKTIAALKQRTGNTEKDENTQIELAGLYYKHGDYDQAWAQYNVILQRPTIEKRNDFYLFHNSAALLLRQGKQEEADRYFQMALSKAHKDTHDNSLPTSQVTLGTSSFTVLNGAKNTSVNGFAYSEAISDEIIIENKTSQVPDASNWLFATDLGMAMNEIGLTNNALTLLKQVVHLQPNEPQALFALASAEASAKEYGDALETVRHGIALNPNDEDSVLLEKKLVAENILTERRIPAVPATIIHSRPKHKIKH